jgi:GTPase SAR1 family protein
MNHKEITQTNIDNNFKNIIDCIIKKAQLLFMNSTVINRRELVDYINFTLNIHIKESAHIKQLIKTAYEKSSYSKSIQEALVDNILENDGKNSVYNPA